MLVDGSEINDGKTILLVDGPTIDTVLPVVETGISVTFNSIQYGCKLKLRS